MRSSWTPNWPKNEQNIPWCRIQKQDTLEKFVWESIFAIVQFLNRIRNVFELQKFWKKNFTDFSVFATAFKLSGKEQCLEKPPHYTHWTQITGRNAVDQVIIQCTQQMNTVLGRLKKKVKAESKIRTKLSFFLNHRFFHLNFLITSTPSKHLLSLSSCFLLIFANFLLPFWVIAVFIQMSQFNTWRIKNKTQVVIFWTFQIQNRIAFSFKFKLGVNSPAIYTKLNKWSHRNPPIFLGKKNSKIIFLKHLVIKSK